MKEENDVVSKALSIAEEIRVLRNAESFMQPACAGRSDVESAGRGAVNLPVEGLSAKPDAVRDKIEALRMGHDDLMSQHASPECWEHDWVVMCCGCGRLFFLEEIGGRFMSRECPLCGCRLHEGAYDKRARTLARRAEDAKRGGDEAGRREALDRISRLAMARYLTSEWYLLTGTPTSALGFHVTDEGYSFTPAYDKIGRFFLKSNYGMHEVLGIKGEMALFDSLRMRVNDRCSPLYGSKIIPNVDLVTNKDDGGRLKVLKNQTDCILLTPAGAFVFEVKRWCAKMRVHAPQMYMEVTRKGRTERYRSDEGPVAQVRANRKSLLAHCGELQGERVCSVVVFVDPIELKGDVGELPCGKGVFFGQVVTGGKSSVRKEIERCVREWRSNPRNIIGPDISEIAGRLLAENSRHALPVDPMGRM